MKKVMIYRAHPDEFLDNPLAINIYEIIRADI